MRETRDKKDQGKKWVQKDQGMRKGQEIGRARIIETASLFV